MLIVIKEKDVLVVHVVRLEEIRNLGLMGRGN